MYLYISLHLLLNIGRSEFICGTPTECIGQSWNVTYAYARGYRSLSGTHTSLMTIGGAVGCQGSFSCSNISFLTSGQTITCSGASSCSHISSITSQNEINCDGSNACSYTTFDSVPFPYIACRGDKSCAHSEFHDTKSIEGYGGYSLYKSTIYSVDGISIRLRGHLAGFGAKLLCAAGHSCSVDCRGNGCSMFYTECIGDCSISKASENTIEPISNLADFNPGFQSYYDSSALLVDNDILCNSHSNTAFDDNSQTSNGHDILVSDNVPICCRGSSTCSEIGTIKRHSAEQYPIICDGENACYNSNPSGRVMGNIVNNGNVFCGGSSSCRFAHINTTNDVYCLGRLSCGYSEITNAQNVYCSGDWSCSHAILRSNGSMGVYLIGRSSSSAMNIYCTIGDLCYIWCRGYGSCGTSTKLHCIGGHCHVDCDTDTGCPVVYTSNPTIAPTRHPTISPTSVPTSQTLNPSATPSVTPTTHPSTTPTTNPSATPTIHPIDPSATLEDPIENYSQRNKVHTWVVFAIAFVCVNCVLSST